MKPTLRVALLIETSNAYARGLLRGIRSYLHERSDWSVYLGEHSRGESAPRWLREWRGDGVIARIETPAVARVVADLKLPTIDVSAARYLPEIPFVETDDVAIGRMGFEHLRGKGLRTFAFCGDERFRWSRNRRIQFQACVSEAGMACHTFEIPAKRGDDFDLERNLRDLAAWLVDLPKPIGILTAYDILGRQVLDLCRETGIDVPDQAAVLGVDNDELLCDFASPPLSSIEPDAVKTGWEAASLLGRLMAGDHSVPQELLVPPLGTLTRGSTDLLAIDDIYISRAVRFIRENAVRGIQVADILEAVPLSRRLLESRFRELLGRTPHEEIERVRMEHVKRLLTDTDLSLAAITQRCGYKHMEYLSVAFKRVVGKPPGQFRQEHRH